MSDKISVIVPVYNVEAYLDRCIKSIIKQTYNNLEIILIDDGSSDKSSCICDQWAACDDRIIVIHKTNCGLSAARNSGIEVASGTYISFIDSDDCVDPFFIETLYNTLITGNAEISVVYYKMFKDERAPLLNHNKRYKAEILSRKDAVMRLFSDVKFGNYACNKLYKRELFDDIRYPYGKKMEDLGVTYKLLFLCNSVALVKAPLYFYYQRADSILHTPCKSFYNDRYELSKERFLFLEKIYPDLDDNYVFFFKIIIESLPYLDDAEFVYAKNEAQTLWGRVSHMTELKVRIKYDLFRYIPNIYFKLLKKC